MKNDYDYLFITKTILITYLDNNIDKKQLICYIEEFPKEI